METATKSSTALDRMALAAVYAGCPRDQVENFIRGKYAASPKQLEFHAACREADKPDGPTMICFGGRRGPGKSHAAFAQTVLDDCIRFPGLKVLFLRKIGKAAKESFEDLRQHVLFALPHEYSSHRGLLKLGNGSRVITGHFNSDKDIDAYLGVEYDAIVVEEANTLTSQKLTMLFGSLRTSKEGWRPRGYFTVNPGGVGHGHIKRQFVIPWRNREKTPEKDTRFIPAGVYDNPFVNENYRRYLEGLTGWLRQAWLEGNWDIAAGQFFTNWNDERHVLKPPYPSVPLDWMSWCSMDYGNVHPTVCHLLALSNEGDIYVVDEYAARRQLVPNNAKAIKNMLNRNDRSVASLRAFVAGSDVFAEKEAGEPTIAEKYKAAGIKLTTANSARISGAAQVLHLLGDEEHKIRQRLFIFDRCTRLIETLPTLEHDPKRPEDVLKVHVDEDGFGGDDAYDCLRYGLMSIPTKGGVSMVKYT